MCVCVCVCVCVGVGNTSCGCMLPCWYVVSCDFSACGTDECLHHFCFWKYSFCVYRQVACLPLPFRVQRYRCRFLSYRLDTALNSCGSSECSDDEEECVMVSLGGGGLLLTVHDVACRRPAPPLCSASTTAASRTVWRHLPSSLPATQRRTYSHGPFFSTSHTTMTTVRPLAALLPQNSTHQSTTEPLPSGTSSGEHTPCHERINACAHTFYTGNSSRPQSACKPFASYRVFCSTDPQTLSPSSATH